ncbi:hypothetical protein Tco_0451855 [Tanacetum coccineum]
MMTMLMLMRAMPEDECLCTCPWIDVDVICSSDDDELNPSTNEWRSRIFPDHNGGEPVLDMKSMQDHVRAGVIPYKTDQDILDEVVPSTNRQNMSGKGRKLPNRLVASTSSHRRVPQAFPDVSFGAVPSFSGVILTSCKIAITKIAARVSLRGVGLKRRLGGTKVEEKLAHLRMVVKFEVLIEKKKLCSLGLMRFDWWMEFLMVHLEELEMKKFL